MVWPSHGAPHPRPVRWPWPTPEREELVHRNVARLVLPPALWRPERRRPEAPQPHPRATAFVQVRRGGPRRARTDDQRIKSPERAVLDGPYRAGLCSGAGHRMPVNPICSRPF